MIDRREFMGAVAGLAANGLPPAATGIGNGLVFNVRDYGALADGSDDGPAIRRALDAAIAGRGVLAFPPGTYTYATSPNFAADDLEIVGYGRVVLRHTGGGPGFLVDGTEKESQVFNMRVENLILDGNAAAGDGFLFRAVHHGRFARLRVIGGAPARAGFRTEFFVANYCESWYVSANDRLAGRLPGTGILLTSRPDRESYATVDSTFVNCICEGCDTAGMVLEWARNNLIRGGTLENNRSGTGLVVMPSATGNTFDGVYLEDNLLNVDCRGAWNQLTGLYATGSPCRIGGEGHCCRVHGGYYTTLAIEPGVRDTKLLGVAAAWLRDSGVRTQRRASQELIGHTPLPDLVPHEVMAPGWTVAEPAAPWVDAGDNTGPAAFRLSADGQVRLRGVLRGGPRRPPSTLLVLPEGWRPAFQQRLPVLTGDAVGVVEVRSSGEVVLVAGKGREVSLDGVGFDLGVAG